MEIISGYQDNQDLRNSFNSLTEEIFSFSLEKWYQRGYWTYRYTPHSIVIDKRVVANASTYEMDVLLDGEQKKAIQIGTVMTHPDFRGKGFAGKLMDFILEKYKDKTDLFYLFANDTVTDFYPKYGFKTYPSVEFMYELETPIHPVSNSLIKLDINNNRDESVIFELAKNRQPVSDRFGIQDGQDLFMFHCLYVHPQNLYYDKDLEILAIAKVKDETLYLYDIVSKNPYKFSDIIPKLDVQGIRKIIFYFTPDKLDIEVTPIRSKGEDLFFTLPINSSIPFETYPPATGEA